MAIQIDVKRIENNVAVCNLYTGDRCVKILMTEVDYYALMRDGFFIRDGLTADSADVINTTREYNRQKVNPPGRLSGIPYMKQKFPDELKRHNGPGNDDDED